MMNGITELGYVRFGVSNLAEWREMVENLIGLEVFADGDENRLFLRSDMQHHRFELVEDGSDDMIGAGLRVAGPDEFVMMQRTLSEAGIGFEIGSADLAADRRVLEVMSLQDPAGNPIEIFHGPQVDAHKPFYPSRRMFGRFVTGDGGAGHMILRHDGLEKSYEFYRLLGMRGNIEYQVPQEDNTTRKVLFMHCNSRDHSLAFGPPSRKNINHLMIEVDNIDDVFYSHERVQESNYPVMISLGKHANDHMFSFYFATPSGFLIEIGYAGRPATHQSEYYTRDTYGHVFSEQLGQGMSIDND